MKSSNDVGPLVESPHREGVATAYICGNCVELCGAILERAAGHRNVEDGPISSRQMSQLQEQVDEVLQVLSEREREVIELRFGLSDGSSYTPEEVAHRLNLTPEAVAEIEARATRRITR